MNDPSSPGCSLLHVTCLKGKASKDEETHLAVVKLLVEAGADVFAVNDACSRPIDNARKSGCNRIVAYLAKQGEAAVRFCRARLSSGRR